MAINKLKTIPNPNSDSKDIVDHVIKNDIVVHSSEILHKLLNKYPAKPGIIRVHEDPKKNGGALNGAAELYNKAAELVLDKDKVAAAIALKAIQWQINSPTLKEVKNFLGHLKVRSSDNTPAKLFFSQLNIQEFVALISAFQITRLSPEHTLKKVGDLEDSLYFVISGILKDSLYDTIDSRGNAYRKPILHLYENDCFGDIYPFNRDKKSHSYIETKSHVELLSIPKETLRKLCTKYPKIEHGLLNLLKVRSKVSLDNSREKLRYAQRLELKLELSVEILLDGSQNTSICLSGFSSDASIGGIRFVLDSIGLDSFSEILSFEDGMKNAKVLVNFPIEDLNVSIPGKITWVSPVSHEGRKTIALGIQFEEMSPKLKGLVMMFFNSFQEK